jgi:uncharacterized protein
VRQAKVVLDTNVLVAGLLNPEGASGRLLDFVLDGMVLVSVDERILREYEEVLCRPPSGLPAGLGREVPSFLRHSTEPGAAVTLAAKLPDTDDLPFLEVTASGSAIPITGNLRHYPKKARGRIPVVSPAEFLELLVRLREARFPPLLVARHYI